MLPVSTAHEEQYMPMICVQLVKLGLITSTNHAKSSKLLKNMEYASYKLSFFTNSFMRLNRLHLRCAPDAEEDARLTFSASKASGHIPSVDMSLHRHQGNTSRNLRAVCAMAKLGVTPLYRVLASLTSRLSEHDACELTLPVREF